MLMELAGYPTYFPDGSFASYDLDTFFENNAEQPLWSPPGVLYNYSNLGMSLAGLVLQEATGKKFADLVETRIFNPAGMDGASMHATVVESTGNFAYGRYHCLLCRQFSFPMRRSSGVDLSFYKG